MKIIDPSEVIRQFWIGLFQGRDWSGRFGVLVPFFFLPVAVGIFAYCKGLNLDLSNVSALVSFYAIFSALLFGAQISSFTIFQVLQKKNRPKKDAGDEIVDAVEEKNSSEHEAALIGAFRVVNANISYLILLSVFLLSILFSMVVVNKSWTIATAILVGATLHLLFVVVMVVRETHLIFDGGYGAAGKDFPK